MGEVGAHWSQVGGDHLVTGEYIDLEKDVLLAVQNIDESAKKKSLFNKKSIFLEYTLNYLDLNNPFIDIEEGDFGCVKIIMETNGIQIDHFHNILKYFHTQPNEILVKECQRVFDLTESEDVHNYLKLKLIYTDNTKYIINFGANTGGWAAADHLQYYYNQWNSKNIKRQNIFKPLTVIYHNQARINLFFIIFSVIMFVLTKKLSPFKFIHKLICIVIILVFCKLYLYNNKSKLNNVLKTQETIVTNETSYNKKMGISSDSFDKQSTLHLQLYLFGFKFCGHDCTAISSPTKSDLQTPRTYAELKAVLDDTTPINERYDKILFNK